MTMISDMRKTTNPAIGMLMLVGMKLEIAMQMLLGRRIQLMYVNRFAKNLRVGDKIVDIQHSTLADIGSLTIRTVVSHERRFSAHNADERVEILTAEGDVKVMLDCWATSSLEQPHMFAIHPDDSVIVEV
jgi:hypothetical protein